MLSYNAYCLKAREIMADKALPKAFDAVVVGTGLGESIVAAAAARAGHSVLHLDANDYYGDGWASFNFEGLQTWIERQQNAGPEAHCETPATIDDGLVKAGERLVPLKKLRQFRKVRQTWSTPILKSEALVEGDVGQNDEAGEGKGDQEEEPEWTREKIMEQSRRFNLDLSPRLLFSRGAMVELLISSNISRYTEFKAVTRVLTKSTGAAGDGGQLQCVPTTKSDIFNTRLVNVVEKRVLTKFMESCVKHGSEIKPEEQEDDPKKDEFALSAAEFAEKPFVEFLEARKLNAKLRHFVTNSIAMVASGASTEDGLKATAHFLTSVGRFGGTPFLWSMYGSGELPQAFCRLCAVFGGVYFLGRALDGLVVDARGRVAAVITQGERVECGKLVLPSYLQPEGLSLATDVEVIAKTVALTEQSMLPDEKEHLSFIALAAEGGPTFVQEVGSGGAVCPQGLTCVYAAATGPDEDPLSILSSSVKPLWRLDFEHMAIVADRTEETPENLFHCGGPGHELDFEASVANAKVVYGAMYPEEEEFLPRAPDPDEIIVGGDEESGQDDKGGDQHESDEQGAEKGSEVKQASQ